MKKITQLFVTTFLLLVTNLISNGQTATITAPTNGASVSVCGFTVNVGAISPTPSDGRLYRIRVRYKLVSQSAALYINIFQPVDGSDTDFGPYAVQVPASGSLLPNTAYNVQARYEVFDEDDGNWILLGTQPTAIVVNTGSAADATPSITSPLNGATGVSITPTIQVAAYAGCGTLTSTTIEVDKGSTGSPADFLNPDFQSTIFNNSNGPFSWPVPVALDYNTSYQARVQFLVGATVVGTTTITFTTEVLTTTPPVMNSPADNSTFTLCNDLVMNVNANSTAARSLVVKVFDVGSPPSAVFSQTYDFANGTIATTPFDVTVLKSAFAPNAQYNVELSSYTGTNGAGTQVGQVYYTLFSGPSLSSVPVITSPTNGSSITSVNPVVAVNPFNGCGTLLSVKYEIDISPADWTGSGFQTETFGSATYSWQVPSFLIPNTTYETRVIFQTLDNGVVANFTSTVVSFTVTNPLVTIITPSPLTNLNPCGFSSTVAAYPSATIIRVEYRKVSDPAFGAILGNSFYPVSGLSQVLYSDVTTGNYTFTFDNTQLQPSEDYEIRFTAGTISGGQFVSNNSSTTLANFGTGNIGGTLTPDFTTPSVANGATGVSLTPTFTIASFAGNCGSISQYILTIVPVAEDFDLNPSLERRYITSASPSITLTPAQALSPSVQYKIRINTVIALNGKDSYGANYFDGSYTFTTAASVLETTLELVTSASKTVNDTIYLNSYSQVFQVTSVSDPRVTAYEIELSKDQTFASNIHYTATSATNVFTFNADAQQLESGERYFIRVRVQYNNSGTPTNGPWTSGSNVKVVYNSLHPVVIVRPTGGVNWPNSSTAIVAWHTKKSTETLFQISTDPSFATLVTDANCSYCPVSTDPVSGGVVYPNTKYRRHTGSAFEDELNYDGFAPQVVQAVYGFLDALTPGQTYYIRSKGVRKNQGGTYLQEGYWNTIGSFSIQGAVRVASFTYPTNGATSIPTSFQMIANPDISQQYRYTAVDFQLSEFADFSSPIYDYANISVARFGSVRVDIANLQYGKTYYMRLRSYATNDLGGPTNPSAWTQGSFTTIAAPYTYIYIPTAGQTFSSSDTTFAHYTLGVVDATGYDWEIENLTNSTTSSNSTVAAYTFFNGFLKPGNNYRVRARAISSSFTGAWSAWVNYSISASGGRTQVNAAAMSLDTEALRAYPNPFTDQILVELPTKSKNTSIQVISHLGQVLESVQVSSSKPLYMGKNLPVGVYTVKITSEDGSIRFVRIIKQH